MFTAPVNDVLNALANASLFAAAKDDQPCLTGVRLRVTGNDLEVIATDRYVIGQARVAGEGTGPDFTELVHPAGLKRVTAVLKKNLGAAVTIEQDGEILRFTIGSETVNVTHMDADVFHYPAVERMFNIPSGPGANYTHIAPKHLALLGKMRDYTLKAADQPGLTLTTGKTPDKPLLGSFGANFRFMAMPVRTTVMPTEHHDAQSGLDWTFGAVRKAAA